MKAPQRKDFLLLCGAFSMMKCGRTRPKNSARFPLIAFDIKKPPDLAPGDFAAHAKFRLLLLPSGPDKVHGMTSHETRWSSIRRQSVLYHAFLRIASPILRGSRESADSALGLRYSALTRQCVVPLHPLVNCAPAKGCVWPVLAPARAWVRAGAVLRGGEGAGVAFCVLDMRVLRFYWDVLRSSHAGLMFLLERFMFDSRLLFDAERQTERLAGGCVSIPPWVGIAISTFSSVSMVIGLCWLTLGLYVF